MIGNHDETDGLRMSDLPNVIIHQGVTKCMRDPNMIIIRREIPKARHQYFTFLISTTSHLLIYLNDRLASGEPLHGNSPVIAPDYTYKTYRRNNQHKQFLPTPHMSRRIREIFRPRFNWGPSVLRAFINTQLLIAESKKKIANDFRIFFMGHRGNIEARYITNKGILSEVVAEIRGSFKRVATHLDTETQKNEPIIQQKKTDTNCN